MVRDQNKRKFHGLGAAISIYLSVLYMLGLSLFLKFYKTDVLNVTPCYYRQLVLNYSKVQGEFQGGQMLLPGKSKND